MVLLTQWISKSLFPLMKSNWVREDTVLGVHITVCGRAHLNTLTTMLWPGSRSLKMDLETEVVLFVLNFFKV